MTTSSNIQRVEGSEDSSSPQTALAMIMRAAQSDTVDVEKMRALMQMHKELLAYQHEIDFNRALSMMQEEIPAIEKRGQIKDSSGNVRSTYPLWEDVNKTIKPIMRKHGFSLGFRIEDLDSGKIRITGVLRHDNGHKEETSISLPNDSSGSKNAVQAAGSSVSYGKRYTAGALLNLTGSEEDDDGVAAGATPEFLVWAGDLENAIDIEELEKKGSELAKANLIATEKTKLRGIYKKRKAELEARKK